MTKDPYAWPGTETLRNLLGIRDEKALDAAECELTRIRAIEADRTSFRLTSDGSRVLHRHLSQDLYEWAGRDSARSGHWSVQYSHPVTRPDRNASRPSF